MAFVISIEGVSTAYSASPVLSNINMNIEAGDFVGIVGPNGSGKTTLLGNLGRLVPYQSGKITMQNKNLLKYKAKEAAQVLSAVPQMQLADIDFRVFDVVMMGRTPHLGFFQSESEADEAIVREAMDFTEIAHLSHRKVRELSGGERQRVFIAQAIAQQPKIMLLDEPTAHLDIHYQIGIMDVLKKLNQSKGVTILAVLHDLNLAAQYCRKIIMLKEGNIAGVGTPAQVLRTELIEDVYQCKVALTQHPVALTPYVVLYSQSNEDPFELPIEKKGTIHVISGGGTGAPLFERLINQGYSVTAGVLNIGDSDWQKAKEMGIPTVEETPFSYISPAKKEENLIMARKSDVVIVAATPIGFGNLNNLEILKRLNLGDVPIILMDPARIEDRDYTNGLASSYFADLTELKNVYVVNDDDILSLLEQISESR